MKITMLKLKLAQTLRTKTKNDINFSNTLVLCGILYLHEKSQKPVRHNNMTLSHSLASLLLNMTWIEASIT